MNDMTALERSIKALSHSTDRRSLEANLRFLWDYFVAHPSKDVPDHLREGRDDLDAVLGHAL